MLLTPSPIVAGSCQSTRLQYLGGVEAAVHAVLKVDFRNAFNSICRDRVLRAVEEYSWDLIPFVHSSYSIPSILMWNDTHKYCQWKAFCKVDPLGHPMLFYLGIHNLISALSSAIQCYQIWWRHNRQEIQRPLGKSTTYLGPRQCPRDNLNVDTQVRTDISQESYHKYQLDVSLSMHARLLQFVYSTWANLLGSTSGMKQWSVVWRNNSISWNQQGGVSVTNICMMPSPS